MKKIFRYLKWCVRFIIIEIPNFIKSRKILKQWQKDFFTKYILCPYGIGDTLFVASLIRAYKEQYGIARVVLVVKKSQVDLPDFFNSIDGKIVSDDIVCKLTRYSKSWRRFAEGNYQYGHFILDHAWPEPGQLLGIGSLNLLDIYKRCILKLPMDTKLELPRVSVSLEKMSEFERLYAKEEKVVLLMPYAVTLSRLPIEFWEKIAQYFKDKFYVVYTNAKDETEKPIKGTEAVYLSLKELFVVSRTFKWGCIALRSGICDLLAYSDIKFITIHNSEDVKKAWNMSGLGLPNTNMVDLSLDPTKNLDENFNDIIKDIELIYEEK